MTYIKDLKRKLEALRSTSGFLFTITYLKDGTIVLHTGMKVNDPSNVSDDTEVVASYDGSSI